MELLILCGGGMGRAAYDTARAMGRFERIAVLEEIYPQQPGAAERLNALKKRYAAAFAAHGDPAVRRALHRLAAELGFHLPPLVHPRAWISPTAALGAGAYVGPLACVNAHAFAGRGCIVNTAAVVEHHCRCGAFCHIAPNAALLGRACVEENALVGAGAVVLPGVCIGAGAVLGAGAVARCDLPPNSRAAGVPAKLLT